MGEAESYYGSYSALPDGGTDEGLVVNPKMQSNRWGPISFIMVLPEEFSPNYPSGQFRPAYEEDCFLTSGAWPLNRIMFNGAEIVDDSANLPIKFID